MGAKTEWRDEVYMKPIAWNYNKGTKQVRTVRFGGLYFEVLGKRYLCCGTRLDNLDGTYLLKNMDTGEFRWIGGGVIRDWLDEDSERLSIRIVGDLKR